MADNTVEGWESRLPKNNIIAMRLEPEVSEKIAKMAWENGIKTTKQAKVILAAGMTAMESSGEIPEAAVPSNQIFKLVGDLPADIVDEIDKVAAKHGRTPQDQARISLVDGLKLQETIDAVSDILAQDPPAYAGDDWKPTEDACLDFIRNSVSAGVARKKRSLSQKREMKEIYEEQGGKCAICGNHIDMDEAVRDLIVPYSEGGSATRDNTRVVCQDCNLIKGGR